MEKARFKRKLLLALARQSTRDRRPQESPRREEGLGRLGQCRHLAVWQHHLHSQVWGDSPGRTAGPRRLPQTDHVPGTTLLGTHRQHERRWNIGQRRRWAIVAHGFAYVALLGLGACSGVSTP